MVRAGKGSRAHAARLVAMFGSHLSIAGSMLNALDEAEKLGMDTVQVFTKNQRQWSIPPLDPGVVRDWRARVAALGWQNRIVSHASYLINLASPDDTLWHKSIELMRDEIERCERLGIAYLVHHPGAFTTSTLDQGLARIAQAYETLLGQTKGYGTVLCLENTVGSGSNIGRDFAELARLRDMILDAGMPPELVGVCFDTCHAHAGGYDLSTAPKAQKVLKEFDQHVGLNVLRVLHLNDSKAPMGSRRDLHEHIGEGTIGTKGFSPFVNSKDFADVPKILETPKGNTPKDVPFDTLNLRRLKELIARSKGSPAQE